MALRGTTPVAEEQRPKVLLFGEAGVGKTTAALQFPQPYVIDAEQGTSTDQYVDLIVGGGGARFQTTDIDEVIEEVRSLRGEAHPYRTLVLDPITTVYDDLVDKCSQRHGEEWGRHYREAGRVMKRLRNLLLDLDMVVVVTAHGKVSYDDEMKKAGTTFDGWKKLDFVFDLVVELSRRGEHRYGRVRKTRYRQFRDGEEFRWSYEVFRERFGSILEREAQVAPLASIEQLQELEALFSQAPVEREAVETKWLKKAGVDAVADMRAQDLGKCLEYLRRLAGKGP